MGSFEACPYCGHRGIFKIWRCRDCGLKCCYKCMVYEKYCPKCGGEKWDEIGWAYG